MPDEQIAAGFKTRCQPIHELFLRRPAEIDHHVATEDQSESAEIRKWLDEVNTAELHHGHHFCSHPIPSFPAALAAEKMFPQPWSHHSLQTISLVSTFACGCEDLSRDIGGENGRKAFSH